MTGIVMAACVALGLAGERAFGFADEDGIGFFGGGNRLAIAASDAWVVEPPRDGPPTPEDGRARKTVLKWIEKHQTRGFRKQYQIVVPDEPTGLPDDYDILIYGRFGDELLMRLEVQVRGGRATAELVTVDGFYRGPLAVGPIDRWTRQLAYAFRARYERRPNTDRELEGGPSSPHYRYQRIELISRDVQEPFHLRTEPWLVANYLIGWDSDGVMGFVHTRYSERIERLARKNLERLAVTDDLGREVVARLQQIETPERADEDENIFASMEAEARLASIEARLYGRLAVYWRLEEALPELRRLGMDDAAIRLAIRIADDPTELLKSALVTAGEDEDLFAWLLNAVSRLVPSKQTEVLLHALPRVEDGWNARKVLSLLSEAQLNAEQLAVIEKFYADTADRHSKVAAARYLLAQTDRDEYYRFLLHVASQWNVNDESNLLWYQGLEHEAFQSVVWYGATRERKRDESTQMVRTLLGRVPMDAPALQSAVGELLFALGRLGRMSDLDLLKEFCDHSEHSDMAIMGIAKIKPDLALEKAREQIRKYLSHEGSFYGDVKPYLGLIVRQDDRSAVPLLETALAKYRRERKESMTPWHDSDGYFYAEIEAVIGYLKAETAEERLAHALAYSRWLWSNDPWLTDVAKRLIREGVDPEACEPLLKPRPEPPFLREAMPWTSEFSH